MLRELASAWTAVAMEAKLSIKQTILRHDILPSHCLEIVYNSKEVLSARHLNRDAPEKAVDFEGTGQPLAATAYRTFRWSRDEPRGYYLSKFVIIVCLTF